MISLAAVLRLSGGDVARKAEDYPARMELGTTTIAAENLGPSVPEPAGGLFTRDYISIEVAFFRPGSGQHTVIAHGDFALRINGARVPLRPEPPGAVAASLKYPDWEQRGQVETRAGVGDADVVLGRPRAVERFPGDHRPAEQQGTGPMPRVNNPLGTKTPINIDEVVARAALPEGDVGLPAAGCLYFPFRGKLKSIKKLELIYTGPLGEGSVRIP